MLTFGVLPFRTSLLIQSLYCLFWGSIVFDFFPFFPVDFFDALWNKTLVTSHLMIIITNLYIGSFFVTLSFFFRISASLHWTSPLPLSWSSLVSLLRWSFVSILFLLKKRMEISLSKLKDIPRQRWEGLIIIFYRLVILVFFSGFGLSSCAWQVEDKRIPGT